MFAGESLVSQRDAMADTIDGHRVALAN